MGHPSLRIGVMESWGARHPHQGPSHPLGAWPVKFLVLNRRKDGNTPVPTSGRPLCTCVMMASRPLAPQA